MRKIVALVLVFGAALGLLAGCSDNEPGKSAAGPVEEPNQVEVVPVELTDEIRGGFYDLAREQRWDFIPWFDAGDAPTDLEAYLDWVMCQAQVWAGFDNPDRELTPAKLSAEDVGALLRRHFAVDVAMPEAAGQVGRYAFDGADFTVPVGGWANLPYGEVTELSRETVDGRAVYTAKLLYYQPADGSLDDIPRETIVEAAADKSAVRAYCWTEAKFYLNEADGEVVFLSMTGGSLAE